jgi:SAM-dependent methyltransferase
MEKGDRVRHPDRSNGYEAIAAEFISRRSCTIGVSVVREWARSLPRGASILDIGCGPGVPISRALIDDGFQVHGVDASPAMIAAFRERCPGAPAECRAVEEAAFFDRDFDAAVSWGLMFLLSGETQRSLVAKVARALKPGGSFLFTAPEQMCDWNDAMTGRLSISFGFAAYRVILAAEGLELVDTRSDEGENHYYIARKA